MYTIHIQIKNERTKQKMASYVFCDLVRALGIDDYFNIKCFAVTKLVHDKRKTFLIQWSLHLVKYLHFNRVLGFDAVRYQCCNTKIYALYLNWRITVRLRTNRNIKCNLPFDKNTSIFFKSSLFITTNLYKLCILVLIAILIFVFSHLLRSQL